MTDQPTQTDVSEDEWAAFEKEHPVEALVHLFKQELDEEQRRNSSLL